MKMRERHNDERKGDATVAGGGGGGSVQDNISQKIPQEDGKKFRTVL